LNWEFNMKKQEAVRTEIRSRLDEEGQLYCEAAHRIAEEVGVEPLAVGEQADGIGVRITRCQLGLFGYAPEKGMPGYRLVRKLDGPPEAAAAAVRKAADQGKIPCLTLWRLGEQHGRTRLDMGNIAETLELKVTPCQLGFF
jgi:hypothetical protein